ncbi:MAG TPA: EthD family reductase [Casimicrobiaceae bacterium]|nr:EthD family reductase [Casimicrobiaceae bacterium]
MTAKLIAMYRHPTDATAFDRYYYATHVPIAKRIPGLRSYEVTRGSIASLGGVSAYHLIATLTFDSLGAIEAALASPQGQATAADLAQFANAGVDVFYADSNTI